jgi:hypothetical protein
VQRSITVLRQYNGRHRVDASQLTALPWAVLGLPTGSRGFEIDSHQIDHFSLPPNGQYFRPDDVQLRHDIVVTIIRGHYDTCMVPGSLMGTAIIEILLASTRQYLTMMELEGLIREYPCFGVDIGLSNTRHGSIGVSAVKCSNCSKLVWLKPWEGYNSVYCAHCGEQHKCGGHKRVDRL